jgi:hypothetical protein
MLGTRKITGHTLEGAVMHLSLFAGILLFLSSVLAQTQDNNVVRSPGRITATVLNDEGEPVREADVCTFVRQANSQSTVCGSLTDKNGEVLIENVNLGEVAVYAENMLGGYWQEGLNLPGKQTLFLTPDEPLRHVILKIGPRPGILKLTLRDKQTRKFVSTATLHFVSAGQRQT